MSPEVMFETGPSLFTIALVAVLALAAAAGAAALLVPPIARRVLPQPKETQLSDFLPFEALRPDGRTLTCRDGSLVRMLAISGVDQAFVKEEDAIALFETRKQLFDDLADKGVTLRIFTTREPTPVPNETGFASTLAEEMAEAWNEKFKRAFITRSVIMISMSGGGEKAQERLDEAEALIHSIMWRYDPKPLTQNPETSPAKDLTIGAFLGKLTAPVSQPNPRGFGQNLNEMLAADEVEFLENGRILFRSADRVKHASVIGIRRFSDLLGPTLPGQLSAINAECTIFQTVEYQDKVKLRALLQQQKSMMASTSFAGDVAQQYEDVIHMIDAQGEDRAEMCVFTETIVLYADDEAELKRCEAECRQILTAEGITSVIEKGATQASWFMQFPTMDLKPRPFRLMSPNVAQLCTFDRPSTGLTRSDWGPGPIARFYTGSNSVYSFQFHISTQEKAQGHGVVIAPTGAGKTVLLEFLASMASRHRDLKVFCFDRYQGQYIWTTAMGGRYLSLNAERQQMSTVGGMNPFQCERTEDNEDFLKQWLVALCDDDSPETIDQVANAIDIAFTNLERHERSLAEIYEIAFEPGSRAAEQLRKWVDPAQYGQMFNAETDCIDLAGNWLSTFDMSNLLDDPVLAGPSVSYIMHRIRQTLRTTGSPGLILIDETAPLLQNEHFRSLFFIMLREFRKLGACVISVFQDPNAIDSAGPGVGDTIRQQCGTFYLFPSPSAQASNYAAFQLNEREISYVLGKSRPTRRMNRSLLIKRPGIQESVVVDVDLSPLGPMLGALSSSMSDVQRANELQRQFGEDWLRKYLDEVNAG